MIEANATTILLDIEGTTTPVEFVYEVLFPFARLHLREFIQQSQNSEDMMATISALSLEHRANLDSGQEPPVWSAKSNHSQLESVIRYVHWLMDQDRKSTALKSLQGKIWEKGYLTGGLRGVVYQDVLPAFARWKKKAKNIYIYSSGSVLAQNLLFAHSTAGDLTGFISGYFDTTTGGKQDPASYRSICEETNSPAAEIIFLSDVIAELEAAQAIGMQTMLCIRSGNSPAKSAWHPSIHTFDVVFP